MTCIFCEEKIPEAPTDGDCVSIKVCTKHRNDMIRKGFGGIMLCNRCKHYLCGDVNCDCECHRRNLTCYILLQLLESNNHDIDLMWRIERLEKSL